jgi:hypothetical protein
MTIWVVNCKKTLIINRDTNLGKKRKSFYKVHLFLLDYELSINLLE